MRLKLREKTQPTWNEGWGKNLMTRKVTLLLNRFKLGHKFKPRFNTGHPYRSPIQATHTGHPDKSIVAYTEVSLYGELFNDF